MRPHIHKKVSWDFNLKLFEKNHLKSHEIQSKQELEDNLNWQKQFTKPCEKCKLILRRLEK